MKDKVKNIIKFLIVGAGIAVIVFICKDLSSAGTAADKMMILSDGFFLSGILLAGLGLLTIFANDGIFLGLSYALKCVFSVFKGGKGRTMDISYFEYKMDKAGKKKPYIEMLISGIVFIAIAAVFTMLFYKSR